MTFDVNESDFVLVYVVMGAFNEIDGQVVIANQSLVRIDVGVR